MNQSKDILMAGIEADARQEEEQLLAKAAQQAADKRKYGGQKAASILAEARERAEKQTAELLRKENSAVDLEIKRSALKLRDGVVRELMRRVEERMKTRVAEPGYRDVLRDWMVEAARGLAVDVATVNASAAEREQIDDALLQEVMERLDRRVVLTLADSAPLDQQGVVLTSADGRMAYNNQVRTRIRRHRQAVQELIHEHLFEQRENR